MGFRTIHLKLHNPGKAKQSVIETSFLNYNNAFDYLLQKAHADIDRIENGYRTKKGTYSTLALSKWVDKDLSKEINRFDIQPFKDSLKLDLGMALANYFVQKKSNPEIPFPHSHGKSRPIYFCRYDTKRSFCLLYDNENDKYFVKLFLMNTKGAKLRSNTTINRELTYIFKNHDTVKPLKKETFIIMPLSFGKWQEEMLKKAIDNPGILRTKKPTFERRFI
jgi:putative transposase